VTEFVGGEWELAEFADEEAIDGFQIDIWWDGLPNRENTFLYT
jgi:hypothetical protein